MLSVQLKGASCHALLTRKFVLVQSVEKRCVMHCTYLQDLGGKVPAHDFAEFFLMDLHIRKQRMENGAMH